MSDPPDTIDFGSPSSASSSLAPTRTINLSATGSLPGRSERHGRMALVEGPRTQLTVVNQQLLRDRLRAAAVVVCIGFGLFLIRSFMIERPLQGFHTLVVFAAGVCVALLSGQRRYTRRQLRLFELAIFGLPVAFFVPYQHLFMLAEAKQGSAVLTLAAFKSVALYWLVTMVFYGLMVPNTWRRAAVITVPLTFVPAIGALVTSRFHPLAEQVVTFDQLSDVQLVLIVGAICSIYGTYIMNSLRQEVFEAKEFGQYRLLERLGQGGMGQVFLAEHQLLRRPCAIKLIHPTHAADPIALARFEREVRSTAMLRHWNTIDIYDYGCTEDGIFYYVMEYLKGFNLSQIVSSGGRLPPGRAIYLLRQVCNALRESHANGLIHRDIKASNIFVTQLGGVYDMVKLLDFGLVRSITDPQSPQLTRDGAVSGTPSYIAPEQASRSHEADERSDIYSLGAVAYFLLTGHVPFEHGSAVEVMVAHLREAVRPPSTLRPDLPKDLEQVVLRCLAKAPADRYQNVDSLDQALASCEAAPHWSQADAIAWWTDFDKQKSVPSPTDDDIVPTVSYRGDDHVPTQSR